MLNLILFDDSKLVEQLKPFTYTRPIAAIRVGILTIVEKWEQYFNVKASYHTQFYLSDKFNCKYSVTNCLLNGSVLPNKELYEAIAQLPLHHALVKDGQIIALKMDELTTRQFLAGEGQDLLETIEWSAPLLQIKHIWDIFSLNEQAIEADFELLTKGRTSQPLPEGNTLLGSADRLFIEKGAKIDASILNTRTGPIYIAAGAEVLEGCMLRGPLAMCEHSATKMGTKIYGATTLGPHCKVGGELNNSVLMGYSNKGHDGFLGNSVIGEWCNLGADTNNSNLKNNYGEVKVWNYASSDYEGTGLQFCGLFMGDHSKCGINTMFNTGTVVGVSANIFGAGFPPKFIPSFAWGGVDDSTTYQLEAAIDTAERMMERRKIEFSSEDEHIFYHIFQVSQSERLWENKG